MVERVARKAPRQTKHVPHGLSRERNAGSALPMIIGLVCAAIILAILWLAYTYG